MKNIYECQFCGKNYPKWEGKCAQCGEWNSLVEIKIDKKTKKTNPSKIYNLKDIKGFDYPRISTLSPEFDRVLGGGLVNGSSILIGGEPGIGKSTLLLSICNNISKSDKKILYVSGEESLEQIKLRADRLGVKALNLFLVSETSLDKVLKTIEENNPFLVVIDSIQAIYDEDIKSPMGSFSQLRQTVSKIIELVKSKNISSFLIGHVTKEGMIAGPKLIEHMVDGVIYFEGDSSIDYRMLRTVKNRFGSTNEIGLFEMTDKGLTDVLNPSSFFLSNTDIKSPIGCVIEGSRPILIETQSLLSSSYAPMPRRTVVGYEANRVAMLLAIMEKFFNYNFSNLDLFVNLVGGLKTKDTSLDLSIITSIASNYLKKDLSSNYILIGEVGLNGEIRATPRVSEKINESIRVGFKNILVPSPKIDSLNIKNDIKLIYVKNLTEVFNEIF